MQIYGTCLPQICTADVESPSLLVTHRQDQGSSKGGKAQSHADDGTMENASSLASMLTYVHSVRVLTRNLTAQS